jgi:8-oxo-dGTP pyrophosphatase MutT (NUDIX family)
MTMIKNKTAWTVIFLLDDVTFTKLVLLYRSANHAFAPHYYTGIGGKVEGGETPLQGAYRELEEETALHSIELTEFARCHIQNVGTLHYFWGVYSGDNLPPCNEGTLEWVDKKNLLSKKLIPTTQGVCLEWEKRKFAVNDAFTVIEKVTSVNEVGVRTVEVTEVINGLHS